MITTILSDFSNVILRFNKPTFIGSLNGLYRELLNSGKPFNFFDYYEFDNELLSYYKKLGKKYSMNIFTTSQIQNDPKSKEVLENMFSQILSAENLGVNKAEPAAYVMVAEKLGKDTEEIVFIDDQIKNIEAAEKAGMTGIHYKNVGDLKLKIRKNTSITRARYSSSCELSV
ncbi:MAG: Phosphoglycolate phosphatase [Microgenomates bacterium OLB23]|nr:MAG: Phosphoglycolate phosphatase [Microgenomates bacterium OLB23]